MPAKKRKSHLGCVRPEMREGQASRPVQVRRLVAPSNTTQPWTRLDTVSQKCEIVNLTQQQELKVGSGAQCH